MIEVRGLTKRYGSTVAVDDLSFDVGVGRVTGFLGPNGAGKSTTLRLMLDLDRGGGSTTFDGRPLHSYPRPSGVVGLLLEARAFHPSRTARSHLRVLAAAGGVPATRADDALRDVGLERAADRRPGKFSLGMSQRLGIAAAVLAQPRYLLLDEPANGLDPEGIVWLRRFLKDYADRGNGVFISSHLLGEMAQLVDEIVVIGRGRLITGGSMEALLASKANARVFVRTADPPRFEHLMDACGFVHRVMDGGLEIDGSTTDEIGRIAFDAGIPLLELTGRQASLEDVFLELTEDAVEFRAQEITDGGEADADACG